MLGINQPYPITLMGRDYVLWQNAQGQISALDNVCPHMQAPLSEGHICKARNTITCPFHALEFNAHGQLYQQDTNSFGASPSATSLDLTVRGDFIWTYGNCSPQQTIPNLPNRITQGMTLIGVASNLRIQADLLRTLKINYDFNHVHVVHGDLLNLSPGSISDCDRDGHTLRLKQREFDA
jgi:phenylpropionate dioxygenase-like ring-hydroxylating dioxygenase large terminal subunit